MNAVDLFKAAKAWGPVLFAITFIAPLIAQSMERADAPVPFGLSPLLFGFAVALPLGFVAKRRGAWL